MNIVRATGSMSVIISLTLAVFPSWEPNRFPLHSILHSYVFSSLRSTIRIVICVSFYLGKNKGVHSISKSMQDKRVLLLRCLYVLVQVQSC